MKEVEKDTLKRNAQVNKKTESRFTAKRKKRSFFINARAMEIFVGLPGTNTLSLRTPVFLRSLLPSTARALSKVRLQRSQTRSMFPFIFGNLEKVRRVPGAHG